MLDDHEIVRRGIADLLDAAPDIIVVGDAGSAAQAVARITALRPQVAVLEAIRQVAAGKSLLDPSVTERVLARLREGDQSDPRFASLTPRERDILALVTEGLTNREIGERLFLAEKTIKNYVSVMLTKLGMERRTQAAVFGAEMRKKDQ